MSALVAVSAVPDEQMIGPAEVAALLQVSTETVYHRARAGDLPGVKVGRLWRFWPSEIREALRPKPVDPWAMPAASRRARRAK